MTTSFWFLASLCASVSALCILAPNLYETVPQITSVFYLDLPSHSETWGKSHDDLSPWTANIGSNLIIQLSKDRSNNLFG